MSLEIWKYPIPWGLNIKIDMPMGARILSTQAHSTESADIAMWAMVDTNHPKTVRRFCVIGMGHPIDMTYTGHMEHIGTVQLGGGELVYHVFERDPFLAAE